ncbi:MAG: translation initiation factor IF-2 [Gemmatimonadaceae bacterium]|nr:translation initiation factor IF-2 [Gemmatimonadaceae bacterium]
MDEVIAMLRSMDVPVYGAQSALTDDHVSRVRARWEREKRARQQRAAQPAAPAGAARRRKGAPAPAPEAPVVAVEAPPVAATATVDPAAGPGAPAVRRRKAADVAAQHAAAAELAAEAAALVEIAAPPAPVVEAAPALTEEVRSPAAAPVEPVAPATEAPRAAPPAPIAPAAATPAAPSAVPSVALPPRDAAPPRPPAQPAINRPSSMTPPVAPVASASPSPRAPLQPPRPASVSAPPRPAGPGGGGDRGGPRPAGAGLPPRPRPAGAFAPRGPGQGGGPGGGYRGPGGDRRGPGGPPAAAGVGLPPRTGGDPRRGGGKKGRRGNVDQAAVDANIAKTMGALRGPAGRRRRFDDSSSREALEALRAANAERERTTVRVNEFITVSELAQILKVPATDIVGFAFKHLGLMVTINQRLDFDQIELIAGEFGFQAVREEEYQVEIEGETNVEDADEDRVPRPPIVTIMGHVDHGKTSLLDYVRKANVVAGEAGGITQHIGAYHVTLAGGRTITFLDTPGHEAFTAMRARGAQVTDIVVLVVAADDQVMPQTIEAISHARNAGVPMIVAINKIDVAGAQPLKVRQELLQHNVVLEDFGGTVLATDISAKKGTNVDQLLEQILLQAELLDLRANPDRRATGTVVEAQLDPGKGPVATILVQNGTLDVGDDFICGVYSGRVRALLDERGKNVKSAGPGIPVQVLGMTGVPMAGDQFLEVEDATAAREIAQRRERLEREARSRRTTKSSVSLEDFMAASAGTEKRTLKLLIKADQGGPAEALADALQQLSNAEVQVEVIQRGVGAISESDILLSKAAGAIIIGFHVRPDTKARAAAEREGVDIKLYRIIYEAVADVKAALEGMLRPEQKEVIFGEAEVREIFRVPKFGVIAGCMVRSGLINRQGRVRVIRDGIEVYEGTIGSLRRFKDDVREVKEGFECGIGVENFNDLKVGDVLEVYRTEQVARTLDGRESA